MAGRVHVSVWFHHSRMTHAPEGVLLIFHWFSNNFLFLQSNETVIKSWVLPRPRSLTMLSHNLDLACQSNGHFQGKCLWLPFWAPPSTMNAILQESTAPEGSVYHPWADIGYFSIPSCVFSYRISLAWLGKVANLHRFYKLIGWSRLEHWLDQQWKSMSQRLNSSPLISLKFIRQLF